MIEEKTRQKYYFGSLIAWGLFFVLVYCNFLLATVQDSGNRIFNSPDENANYLFTKLYSEKSEFFIPEPENAKYTNIIFPRSVHVAEDGMLLSGSFIGIIIIYGLLAKFFGIWIIIFLTPIISFFGAIFFFKLIKEIFSKKIAFISTLLLFIFRAWWYYNSRSMFHNILFVNFIIFFLYCFIKFLRNRRVSYIVGSLAFFALALFTRFSEIVWIAPGFFALLIASKKYISWKIFISMMCLFFAIILGIVYANIKIFGNAITAGYSYELESASAISNVFNMIFPFGFHPKRAFINFYNYYPYLLWWFFIPSILGFIFMLKKFRRLAQEQKYYIFGFCCVSVFLILYYGSWTITDNLDPSKITIGTSYVRYWLCIYIFSLPFAAYFFQKLLSVIKNRKLKMATIFILMVALAYLSFDLVWLNSEESLLAVQKSINGYYMKRDLVSSIISDDSMIVTEKSDKIFFPKYKIISEPNNEKVIQNVKKMISDGIPIYYYTFLGDNDINVYNSYLDSFGMKLNNKIRIFGNENLYSMEIK